MIKFGLKMWSDNIHLFDEALERYARHDFDFVEIYSNSEIEHDYNELKKLKVIPILGVHIGHLEKAGFHTFYLREDQRAAWQMTVDLANFFDAPRIIVHPAVEHTSVTFWENLDKLNDPRILIESMAVVSPLGGLHRAFGTTVHDLQEIKKKKELCFDIAKFIKACVYHNIEYKMELRRALKDLEPKYFHISGCAIENPVDQHDDMWNSSYDIPWIRLTLEEYMKEDDLYLVFETPKVDRDLANDIKNMEYFKKVNL